MAVKFPAFTEFATPGGAPPTPVFGALPGAVPGATYTVQEKVKGKRKGRKKGEKKVKLTPEQKAFHKLDLGGKKKISAYTKAKKAYVMDALKVQSKKGTYTASKKGNIKVYSGGILPPRTAVKRMSRAYAEMDKQRKAAVKANPALKKKFSSDQEAMQTAFGDAMREAKGKKFPRGGRGAALAGRGLASEAALVGTAALRAY